MSERVCKKCGRPLTEEDDDCCPSCNIESMKPVTDGAKVAGAALAAVAVVVAVARLVSRFHGRRD